METQPEPQADYGATPAGAQDHLDLEAMKALYATELGGELFYCRLADVASSERAAMLLRRNGREEANHARRLARAITLKQGYEFVPTPDMEPDPSTPAPTRVSPKFLNFLVKAEYQGDADYRRWAANEPDPAVARLLRLNGRDETNHGNRVQEVLDLIAAEAAAT
jgi:rubrerythrin